jgi:hypothetical protein
MDRRTRGCCFAAAVLSQRQRRVGDCLVMTQCLKTRSLPGSRSGLISNRLSSSRAANERLEGTISLTLVSARRRDAIGLKPDLGPLFVNIRIWSSQLAFRESTPLPSEFSSDLDLSMSGGIG